MVWRTFLLYRGLSVLYSIVMCLAWACDCPLCLLKANRNERLLLDEIFQWSTFSLSKKLIWPSLTLCLVNPHLWQIFLSPQTKFIWHIKIFISIEYIHNSCLWTYVATIVVFRKVFYKEREEIVQNFYFDRIKVWEKISYFHPNPYRW